MPGSAAGDEGDGGTLVQGRYRLLELIGRGGMGEVWRALDEALGRRVAVKCLNPVTGRAHDTTFTRMVQERFRREARVAASLQHRGITVVHDFGEHDGVLFLVMELLDGRNLLQVLDDARRQPLPVPDIADIAEQVAAALAYTHGQGIVHRDLKPANIIRLTDGSVKICDFGIARLGHDIGFSSRLTGPGVAMGTPNYMSPEQIGGSGVDHRSDLYSLGCVLYELATGAAPFDLGDAWAVLVGHRDTPPEPPRGKRPDLPADLERLILDLLAKDPEDRPQSAADVCGRLKAMRAAAGTPPYQSPAPVPAWASGLTTGALAHSTRAHRIAVPPTPGITGAWSTRAVPAQAAPGVSAALAARHTEATTLAAAGRWQQAYDLHTEVAAGRDRALGADHPDTLTSRYEAACCLTRLGRLEEALPLHEYVAAVRARVLGPDDAATLAARHEAAFAMERLGRHEEAHTVYREVLEARERTVGPQHPDTLHCKHNLAFNLGQLGRAQEAFTMAVEVAEARARVLGADDPDTLVTRFEVAHAFGRAGQWEQALETYQEIARARAAGLGPDHPDTLAARYETGICMGRLDRTAEALALFEDLAEARTRTAGSADPETLRARHALGVNLGRLGQWDRALVEARDVAAVRERVLGPAHPDTLVSRREVAVALGWLGRWPAALGHYHEVAEARERVLGPAHPDSISSRKDEADCLEQLGRTAEARALHRRMAELRQEAAEER
ncbi:serine/threonine-protein kinase [Actinacidiphila acididurans]|uniref:serine/threonine-protein kinase n=1 Tax=Actinacidiphila acididurans TaxID=2784346 RepID=UPI0027DC90D2|nr:tetratricopeptide repeat protein [Actinacidiphila acididurans]